MFLLGPDAPGGFHLFVHGPQIVGAVPQATLCGRVPGSLGAGGGFTLALVLMAGLREEAELASVPSVMRGTALTMIIAGLLSLAFMGFAGLFSQV